MYGLNGAPAIWQRYVDRTISGLPLTLATDASPVGIGCVLSHVYQMALNVRSRSHQELYLGREKYSQIDKEALSIVWASFEFDIIFRPKTIEHGNADFLSRLQKHPKELEVKDDITIFQMSQIEALPVTSKELRQETSKDIELGPLLESLKGRHKTSAPFKPSSNGQAERYVATLKQSLRAMHKYEGTIQQKLSTFLMQYREAPNVTTTLRSCHIILKRDIRTRIDLLLPELKTKIQDKLRRDNFEFRDRKFDVGDRVAVRVYRAANTRWKFGTIVNQDGVLHYIIDVQRNPRETTY
ncbi:transposon Tf2-9 polyprotein [Trichonephila clavipes]|nr:transposon Tf2-9 polyprotein [Trichonephila clavipes]